MIDEEPAIEEARALFEGGAERVTIAIIDEELLVGGQILEEARVVYVARNLAEVERFLRRLIGG